jgi:hypothetical protein
MKEIPLTQGKVALVDNEDYEWLNQWKWHYHVYAMRNTHEHNRKKILMHREIIKAPAGMDTDHIDHDKLNNCRSNLRICTRSENQMNRKTYKDSVSGYKGVYFNRSDRVWMARIGIDHKTIYIGSFSDAKNAAMAYDKEAKILFGEFAHLNFPEGETAQPV